MQGQCGLDTALEQATSEDDFDEADAGTPVRTRKESLSKNRKQIKLDSVIDGTEAVRRKDGLI